MDAQQFPTYPDLNGKVAIITGIGQVGIPDSPTWGNGAATGGFSIDSRTLDA